jgi:hypothetical protein
MQAEDGSSSTRPVQVVGLMGDTLTILSSRGEVRQTHLLKDFLQDGWKPVLTGLFDPLSVGVTFTSTPSMIGIGVEGTLAPGSTTDPYALVASNEGSPIAQIPYHIPDDPNPANRTAKIYPVSAFSLGTDQLILTLVSQDRFQYGSVRPENGLKRYRYDGSSLQAVHQSNGDFDYPVAPMTLPRQPAMLYDERTNSNYLTINTATYPAAPRFSTPTPTPPPLNWRATSSDTMYSIDLSVNAVPMTNIGTRVVGSPGSTQGSASTTIATLSKTQGNAGFYRIIAENHDPARPGVGAIVLDTLFPDPNPSRKGFFVDQATPATNLGWTIAVADLDGKAPSAGGRNNNPGDEIIAAWQAPDGGDLDVGWLYVLNFPLKASQKDTLNVIAKQRFSGRLLAAGDLVADTNNRYELVVAHGDTLSILQMKDYGNVDDFNPLIVAEKRHPFTVVRSFVLDGNIVSAALADLEADEENDIVVCTTTSTYAIGMPLAKPFDDVNVEGTEFCQGDSVSVAWGHHVGGGDAGVSVTLRSATSVVPVARHHAVTGNDTIRFGTGNLLDRYYRVFVADEDAPSVVDSSTTIVVNPHAIATIDVTRADSTYHFGDAVAITGHAQCFSGRVKVEQARGASGWDSIAADIVPDGQGAYKAIFHLKCPSVASCAIGTEDSLRFRFAGIDGTIQSPTVAVRVDNPARQLGISPGDDSSRARYRVVTWSQADFACDSVAVSMSMNGGETWKDAGVVPTVAGAFPVKAPIDSSGRILICVHCEDATGRTCAMGRAAFTTIPLTEDFVAPNPYDPTRTQNDITGHGALISYHLNQASTVSITIYDASRAVVRRVVDGEEQPEGRNVATWDGTNSRGEIVANGTYICLIQTSSDEPIILPIVVLKR